MERFSIAITKQRKVEASAKRAWDRLHEFDNLQNVFSTVHNSELVTVNKKKLVGNKVKVSRLLPTGHCFLATYSIVRHDEENREIQFYSEDIGKQGTATASTTWTVEPIDENSCMVTCSFAIVPHKFMMTAGRFVFAPFLKPIVKRTIKQDLKDFAASFAKDQQEVIQTKAESPLQEHTKMEVPIRPSSKFDDEGKEAESSSSERTRSTLAFMDDVSSSISGLSYASRVTPLGRLGYLDVGDNNNIREVNSDGSIQNSTFAC